jgi:hypothetical protein
LPESDPAVFSSRRAAESYAASLARELREEGYRCSGAARDGQIYAEQDADDLGRVIEVTECFEDREDCNTEE